MSDPVLGPANTAKEGDTVSYLLKLRYFTGNRGSPYQLRAQGTGRGSGSRGFPYTSSGCLLSLTPAAAGLLHSLRTYLTHILVPVPEAQQQMGQHVNDVRLKELPQHGAEHLKGKEGSWGRRRRDP